MRLSALFSALMLACLVWIAPAAAQEDAREAFRKGEAAYSVGNYELAITEWTRAYEIDPRPRIQFNLAQAYERLGQWPEAADALKLYLDNADPDDPTYSDANARLSSLRQRLSLTGLVLEGGIDGGTIRVDDKEWGRTPRPDKIPVAPGHHTVVVDWGDRPAFQASVHVPPGKVITLKVDTPEARGNAAAANVGPSAAAPVDGGDNRLSNGLFIGAGAAGAVMIASLVYTLNRKSEYKGCGSSKACTEADIDAIADANDTSVPPNANIRDMVSSQSDLDAVKTQRMIGIIGTSVFAAAAVGLAVGGILTRNKGGSADRRATRCSLGFTGGSCTVSF